MTTTSKLIVNGRFLTQQMTGVQRVGLEFCRALDQLMEADEFRGMSVEVVLPAKAPQVIELNTANLTIKRFGSLRGHLWEQIDLPRYASGKSLLCLGNTAPLISLFSRRTRPAVMVHDLSYKYFPEAYSTGFRALYNALIPTVLKRASIIITVSESERRAIIQSYPRISRNRIVAIQNGASTIQDEEVAPRAARQRKCLYVGSLTKRKNASGILAAAIDLARNHDVTFTFVGAGGPSFEGVEIPIPDDVSASIHFLGQVNDQVRLAKEYESAAVFLFPSFYEASPLPPTEAMAHGCPVVASDIPSLRERCKDAARYHHPADVDGLVGSVVDLMDDDEAWLQAQRRGLRVSSSYSWLGQARRIVSIVKQHAAQEANL